MEPVKKTILVADDEPDLREMLACDFEDMGHRVLQAENGKVALEILQANGADLVVSDICMPKMDGVGLLARIRDIYPEDPPVFFITGYADVGVEEAFHLGADALFAKPFDRRAFLTAVNRVLVAPFPKWKTATDMPANISRTVARDFDSIQIAGERRKLSIGRKGMFLGFDDSSLTDASPGEWLNFDIRFRSGEPRRLRGTGVVRWSRRRPGNGLPAGCGVEFMTFADSVREEIIRWVSTLKCLPTIPKQ